MGLEEVWVPDMKQSNGHCSILHRYVRRNKIYNLEAEGFKVCEKMNKWKGYRNTPLPD